MSHKAAISLCWVFAGLITICGDVYLSTAQIKTKKQNKTDVFFFPFPNLINLLMAVSPEDFNK